MTAVKLEKGYRYENGFQWFPPFDYRKHAQLNESEGLSER